MNEAEVFYSTVYLVRHGSRAYGTALPTSDQDEKGVAILADPKYYFGFANFEQKDKFSDDVDRVIYDIRKFVRLAADCNPNIIETLFVDESDILKMDTVGAKLRANASMFLSRKAAHTFTGYARSQLHRMKNHHEWLINPPKVPLSSNHFSMEKDRTQYQRKFGEYEIYVNCVDFNVGLFDVGVMNHGAYDAERKKYSQYLDWIKNRNPLRAELEAQYGYDCKHANHLVRLLRMGKEIVTEGVVRVRRPDAEELLAIRKGEFAYADLLKMAEDLSQEVFEAVKTSPLPEAPPLDSIEELQMELINEVVRRN